MTKCKICGSPCLKSICDKCKQQMADGSWRDDIWQNVKNFDDTENRLADEVEKRAGEKYQMVSENIFPISTTIQ